MKNNNQKTFFASTELVGAFLIPQLNDGEMLDFLINPIEFIYQYSQIEIPTEFAIKVVVNTNDSVSLSLPYYSALKQCTSEKLEDKELEVVSAAGHALYEINEVGRAFAEKQKEDKINSMGMFGSSLMKHHSEANNVQE